MATTNQQIMDAFLGKLYDIVSAKNTIHGVEEENPYISFTRPGIPITEDSLNFGFTVMNESQNILAADFADLVNSIPITEGFYNPTGRKVFDEYYKIINQPVLPIAQLSQQEQEQLERVNKFLFKEEQYQDVLTGDMVKVEVESLVYERYKMYKQKYDSSFLEYQKAFKDYMLRSDNPTEVELWAQTQPILKSKVDIAYSAWQTYGLKSKIEEAQALKENLERRGPNRLWEERRIRYRSHTRNDFQGGTYQLTKFFPDKFWLDNQNSPWMEYSFLHKEVHKVDTSSNESYGGGAGASFGLWSFGGKMNRETKDTYLKHETEDFTITFELAKIPLRRTWMDASVFSSKAWKFDNQVIPITEHLSDGGNPPKGTMVSFPTSLLVVRNVNIKTDMTSLTQSSSWSKITGSARAGWGPFSVRGNYSKEQSKQTHDFLQTGEGIEIPGMQIIGFVCQKLAKCPNPDSTLNWPK